MTKLWTLGVLSLVCIGCGNGGNGRDCANFVLPADVVAADACPPSHSDPFLRDRDITLDDDVLSVRVEYSGGCTVHELLLRYEIAQAQLFLAMCHNANGDNCEAIVSEGRTFDLRWILCESEPQEITFLRADGSESDLTP